MYTSKNAICKTGGQITEAVKHFFLPTQPQYWGQEVQLHWNGRKCHIQGVSQNRD